MLRELIALGLFAALGLLTSQPRHVAMQPPEQGTTHLLYSQHPRLPLVAATAAAYSGKQQVGWAV